MLHCKDIPAGCWNASIKTGLITHIADTETGGEARKVRREEV